MITIKTWKGIESTFGISYIFNETINLYPIFADYFFQVDDTCGTLVMPIFADIVSGGNLAFIITDRRGIELPKKAVKIIERAKKRYEKFQFHPKVAERIRRNARIRFIKAVSDEIYNGYFNKVRRGN